MLELWAVLGIALSAASGIGSWGVGTSGSESSSSARLLRESGV